MARTKEVTRVFNPGRRVFGGGGKVPRLQAQGATPRRALE